MNKFLTTDEFISRAKEIYGDKYEYLTDRNDSKYWGHRITIKEGKNNKIGIKCNKHQNVFETHPKEFLEGKELCPICNFENSNFKFSERNKNDYFLIDGVFVNNTCTNNILVKIIINFIKNNTNFLGYFDHNCYINYDYTIDVEIKNLNDLNKDWRGFSIYIESGTFPSNIKFNSIITSTLYIFSGKYNTKTNSFNITHIDNLFGLPKELYGSIWCVGQNLNSLVGIPKKIYGSLNVRNNNISNLDGCSEIIYGDFDISKNKIRNSNDFKLVNCEVFGNLNRKNNLFIE